MGLMKHFVAGLRTIAAAGRSSPGRKRDWAMIQYRESTLQEAHEKGLLPEGTLEYAREIIELRIQGKLVAMTRWAWASRLLPFRSYDSEMTKGINIQRSLSELEQINKANPDLSLDELIDKVRAKFWHHL